MLTIIYGKEREKGRARFRALREELRKKSGEEELVHEGMATVDFFEGASVSQGIFGAITLFIFDCIFEKKSDQEILLANAPALVASPNYFLVFEPSLEKSSIDDLKKTGAVLEEFVSKKIDTRPEFNIFSLGDALGKRNKKELWVLYQQAQRSDISAEEICGTLFWAVKNLALMKNAKAGDDAGMSPFVAKKSRGFSVNYSDVEIANLSHSLITIYHEAHRGGEPMEVALERLILEL